MRVDRRGATRVGYEIRGLGLGIAARRYCDPRLAKQKLWVVGTVSRTEHAPAPVERRARMRFRSRGARRFTAAPRIREGVEATVPPSASAARPYRRRRAAATMPSAASASDRTASAAPPSAGAPALGTPSIESAVLLNTATPTPAVCPPSACDAEAAAPGRCGGGHCSAAMGSTEAHHLLIFRAERSEERR